MKENRQIILKFESTDPDARSEGGLDDEPRYIADLKTGDQIDFKQSHTINTENDDYSNLVERYVKRCFVTNRVLRDGQRMGYIYREDSDFEDSTSDLPRARRTLSRQPANGVTLERNVSLNYLAKELTLPAEEVTHGRHPRMYSFAMKR